MKERAVPRLRLLLLIFSSARLVLNTGFRMAYPFLPAFSRGLGVDLDVRGKSGSAATYYTSLLYCLNQ